MGGLSLAVAQGVDRLDRRRESLLQQVFAARAEGEREPVTLEVLALADDLDIGLGTPVGLGCERVSPSGLAAPGVRVGRGQDDPAGIGPVVVQGLPYAAGALSDVSFGRALAEDLEVTVGTVAPDLCAALAEIGERRDELLGRRGHLLRDVHRRHVCSSAAGERCIWVATSWRGCADRVDYG